MVGTEYVAATQHVTTARDLKLQRTVLVRGLTLDDLKEGSKIRELFDVREYGASQIADFCVFRDGCLIEYVNPTALERVSTINAPEQRIQPAVPFKEFTVEEGRHEEQKRTLQQKDGELIALRQDLQHERQLREAAQGSLATLHQQLVQLDAALRKTQQELSAAQAAAAARPAVDYVATWQQFVAAYSYLDSRNASPGLSFQVGGDPFVVRNISRGTEPCVVQADRPLQCIPGCNAAVGYFEVRILDLGTAHTITVGVAPTLFSRRNQHPGWAGNSYGLHGDDGFAYGNATESYDRAARVPNMTAPFARDDVIGCGYIWNTQEVFFTRNGTLLGRPFRQVIGGMHATVGSVSAGETYRVNFGKEPFVFNVFHFAQSVK